MCNCYQGCEPKSITLIPEEIRTLTLFVNQYQTAMARAQMASELEAQYTEQLRAKYGLGPEWTCNDVLTGFERVEAHSHDQDD